MRVTRDALTVETPRWLVGDPEFDMLDYHDHLLAQSVVPVAPYNPQNTADPLDINYRVEQRIKEQRLWVYGGTNSKKRTRAVHKLKQRLDLGLGTPRV